MRPDQTLSLHPLAGKFPHLLGAEFDELVADIKTHGLHEPITRFEGQILDGWNRYRACLRLKIEPRFEEFEGDAAAALAFVRSKNIVRRHLTAKAKRDAIATLLKANPEQSNSAIAKIAKVNDKTVGAVRANLERRSEIPNVTTRKDTKGRKQPARKASKAKPTAEPKRDSDNAPDPEAAAEKRKQEFAAMEAAGKSTAKAQDPKPARPTARNPALDDELVLLREFARFVLVCARSVSVDPKDHPEWKALRDKVKATSGVAP